MKTFCLIVSILLLESISRNLKARYQFTGREKDDVTVLYYYRARQYDSKLGRFISEDPIGFAGGDINLYGYVGNNPVSFKDSLGLMQNGPTNYLRNPFSSERWVLNGLSNTVSDLLGLDNVAKWGWQIGDYRCSTKDRILAGLKLTGHTAITAAGGAVFGKAAKGLAGAGRERLVHLTNSKAATAISKSGIISGSGGSSGNIYATVTSNASSAGRALTTGLRSGQYQAAIPIPSSASGAFSKVLPIGPFSALQFLSGTQYTARGALNLTTGSFTRAGINSNQAVGYAFDAVATPLALDITRTEETGCGCK